MKPTTSEDRLLLERDCARFLYREASLLDRHRLEEWYALLTDDVSYRVPTRTSGNWGANAGFSDDVYLMQEDADSIRARIEQLSSDHSWSEDPPSRTRRIVSNVLLEDVDDPETRLRSSLVFLRSQGDQSSPIVLSGTRQDVLRLTDGGWKLADREVRLDHTVVNTESFGTFL